MKIVTVDDDIDMIRPYWNDIVKYLVIEGKLIVKLGHLYLQTDSPCYNQYDVEKDKNINIVKFSNTRKTVIYHLPLSKFRSKFSRYGNFSSVIGTLSRLVLRCNTPIQVSNDQLSIRYDKIQIAQDDMQWILVGHPRFYHALFHLRYIQKTFDREIANDIISKMVCCLCRHDEAFSHEIIRILMRDWLVWFRRGFRLIGFEGLEGLTMLRYLLNINDEIQNDRFKMLCDCESDPIPDLRQKNEQLYPLIGESLDVFTLINDLQRTINCLRIIECLLETMKENENFRKFINEFRFRTNSRWGKYLDRMVKMKNPQLYNEMKWAIPQIIQWKV